MTTESKTLSSVHGGHSVKNQLLLLEYMPGVHAFRSGDPALTERSYLRLAHLAMRMDRPDAHNTGRPHKLAKQRSPDPPMQESELGHRAAEGRLPGQQAED